MKSDLRWLKHKVDLGADYIVTQMFFDNKVYFDFVNNCLETGINVPIIPGLKPISTRSQMNSIPKHFYINLPDALVDEIDSAKNDEAVRKIGVEWCISQSKELKSAGVPVLHYYSMGKPKSIKEIAKAVF